MAKLSTKRKTRPCPALEEEARLKRNRQSAATDPARERLRLERELLENEELGNWPRVFENLDGLEELLQVEERLLQNRRQEADRRLSRHHRLRYIDMGGGKFNLLHYDFMVEGGQCRSWLLPDGQTMALPFSRGVWMFILLLAPTTATMKGAIVFRADARIELADFLALDHVFWIAGRQGEVFVVAHDGSTFQAIYPPLPHLGEEQAVESALLAPPHHLWLLVRELRTQKRRAAILTLKTRHLREVGEGGKLLRLKEGEPSPICRTASPEERAFIHTGAGRPTLANELAGPNHVADIVGGPAADGYVVLHPIPAEKKRAPPYLALSWVDGATGTIRHTLELREAYGLALFRMAAASGSGCVFLTFMSDKGQRELVAFTANRQEFREQWRVSGVGDLIFIGDHQGRRTMAVFLNPDRGLTLVELDARPPDSLPQTTFELPQFDFGQDIYSCTCQPKDRHNNVQVVANYLREQQRIKQDFEVKNHLKEIDEDGLLIYYGALQIVGQHARAEALKQRLIRLIPDHPEVVVMRCHALAREGNFSAMETLLEKTVAAGNLSEQGEHLHHLLGIARLQLGDLAGAIRAWLAGRKCQAQGLCDLSALIAAIEPASLLLQGVTPKTELGDLAWLIQTLGQADQSLRAGRGEEVLELLYCNRHWQIATHHSLARLVRACLLREPSSGAEEFQGLLVMTVFMEASCSRKHLTLRRPLPPSCQIAHQEMEELQRAALTWLDR